MNYRLSVLSTALLACFVAMSAAAQAPAPLKAPSYTTTGGIHWQDVFGSRKSEPHTVYLLLASGYFRAPAADSLGKLITSWAAKHPSATAAPVYSAGPISASDPQSRYVWVWIYPRSAKQGGETLNEFLVRQGVFPGGVMTVTRSASSGGAGRDKPGAPMKKFLVSQATYNAFLRRITVAEREAAKGRRGIWAKGGPMEQLEGKGRPRAKP